MFAKPKLILRTYAIISFGVIIALYILRPQWSGILWPATILNGLLCSWYYRRLDRVEPDGHVSS